MKHSNLNNPVSCPTADNQKKWGLTLKSSSSRRYQVIELCNVMPVNAKQQLHKDRNAVQWDASECEATTTPMQR